MARFATQEPTGQAVQELEKLVRVAVFKTGRQVVEYLLQEAANRIDAAYQPKPGQQRKRREQIKTVIGSRCKQSGMLWGKPGVENILALRCIYSIGRLDQFWKDRLNAHAARNDCLNLVAEKRTN